MAEDLIADKVMIDGPRAVAYEDPTAGEPGNLGSRLPDYNLHNDIQVTTWDGYLANYSIVYAFGAYLARSYGGAALFGDIVQSDRAGVGAIEAAVRSQGHDQSFLDLLTNWGAANLLSDNTAAPAPYQYNTAPGAPHTPEAWSSGWGRSTCTTTSMRGAAWPAPVRTCTRCPCSTSACSRRTPTCTPRWDARAGALSLRVTAESENRITVVVKE